MSDRLRLCYVDEPWAWFTTQPVTEQWGDDWNDAPYEHNAGEPYTGAGYEIVKVAYEAYLVTPDNGHLNSPYSVQTINQGFVPWLTPCPMFGDPDGPRIWAGATLPEFIAAVRAAKGDVWTPAAMEPQS